jgi:hypothetical protein
MGFSYTISFSIDVLAFSNLSIAYKTYPFLKKLSAYLALALI